MKFCLDARHSPGRILMRHASDQVTNLPIDPRASDTTSSGLPAPITLEALPMPLNNCLWFDDDKDGVPIAPQMRQDNPKQTFSISKPRYSASIVVSVLSGRVNGLPPPTSTLLCCRVHLVVAN